MTEKTMTQEGATRKCAVLQTIIEDAIKEYRSLNTQFGLGLSLGDLDVMQSIAEDIADERGWNSSNCY